MKEKKNLIFHPNLAQAYYKILGPWEAYLHTILKTELKRRFWGMVGKTALEIGCGPGRRAYLLRELGFDVTACELSPFMLRQARFTLKGKVEVLEMDAHDMSFEDGFFDISFLIFTLSCVRDHLQVLRETVRVTRQCMFVAEINPFSILGLRFLFERSFKNSVFKDMYLYSPWSIKAIVKGIPGVKSVSGLNPSWNPFTGVYVFVSDIYYDKVLNLKPILKDKVKGKVVEGLAITFKHMGGQNEKSLSL
jgi:ubiquinone/menaquinone biosynthesis C-methylase UbiE